MGTIGGSNDRKRKPRLEGGQQLWQGEEKKGMGKWRMVEAKVGRLCWTQRGRERKIIMEDKEGEGGGDCEGAKLKKRLRKIDGKKKDGRHRYK